jgi:hypothetical protein
VAGALRVAEAIGTKLRRLGLQKKGKSFENQGIAKPT